jgi:hypothetical protein
MTEQTEWLEAEGDAPAKEPAGYEYVESDIKDEAEYAAAAAEDAVEPESDAAEPESDAAEPESQDDVAKQRDGILKEFRETRDALKRERAENAARNQLLEERLGRLLEVKEQAEAPPVPDPVEDPLGHLSHQQGALMETQQQINARIAAEQAQREQVAALNQAKKLLESQEQAFRQEAQIDEETYESALEFARNQVQSYYESMGMDSASAAQAAGHEQLQFAAMAMQAGKNPGEARYRFAEARGFKKAEPEQTDETAGPALADTLQFKKDAVAASKSLGRVPGTQGKRRITLDDLANAPNDVFDKITSDPALFEKLSVEGSLLI